MIFAFGRARWISGTNFQFAGILSVKNGDAGAVLLAAWVARLCRIRDDGAGERAVGPVVGVVLIAIAEVCGAYPDSPQRAARGRAVVIVQQAARKWRQGGKARRRSAGEIGQAIRGGRQVAKRRERWSLFDGIQRVTDFRDGAFTQDRQCGIGQHGADLRHDFALRVIHVSSGAVLSDVDSANGRVSRPGGAPFRYAHSSIHSLVDRDERGRGPSVRLKGLH